MPKHTILFCRFPGNNSEHPATSDWYNQTVLKAKADPRIGEMYHHKISDTPITMSRNRACEIAKKVKADIVVMWDSDMHPDLYLGEDPEAAPFWDTSLNFILKYARPCCIFAPYCGPPPWENVYVFRWRKYQSDMPPEDAGNFKLDQFTREEAHEARGIMEVAAGPTGLIMFPTTVLDMIKPPYFYYEWTDETQSNKASTEDVVFTRDLSLQGAPQFCNFHAWAGHYKLKCVGRPQILTRQDVDDRYVKAMERNRPLRKANGEAIPGHMGRVNPPCAAISPERQVRDVVLHQAEEEVEAHEYALSDGDS